MKNLKSNSAAINGRQKLLKYNDRTTWWM